jgi:hypothetical protein
VPFTESEQTSNESTTKLLQHQTSQEVTNFQIEQKQTDSQQNHNNNLPQKCATGVYHKPSDPDLAKLVEPARKY